MVRSSFPRSTERQATQYDWVFDISIYPRHDLHVKNIFVFILMFILIPKIWALELSSEIWNGEALREGTMPGWAYQKGSTKYLICISLKNKLNNPISANLIRGFLPTDVAGAMRSNINEMKIVGRLNDDGKEGDFKKGDQVFCTEYDEIPPTQDRIPAYAIYVEKKIKGKISYPFFADWFYLNTFKFKTPKGGVYFIVDQDLFFRSPISPNFYPVVTPGCSNIFLSLTHETALIFSPSSKDKEFKDCNESINTVTFHRGQKIRWTEILRKDQVFSISLNSNEFMSDNGSRIVLGTKVLEEDGDDCADMKVFDENNALIYSVKDKCVTHQQVSPNGNFIGFSSQEGLKIVELKTKKPIYSGQNLENIEAADDGGFEVVKYVEDGKQSRPKRILKWKTAATNGLKKGK